MTNKKENGGWNGARYLCMLYIYMYRNHGKWIGDGDEVAVISYHIHSLH